MIQSDDEYELVLTPPAGRPLTEHLPEAVAGAVIDFMTTALVRQPLRVGKPLRGELTGVWSARRGTYRVLYRVRAEAREVIVLRIEHRRDAYRPALKRRRPGRLGERSSAARDAVRFSFFSRFRNASTSLDLPEGGGRIRR